MNHIIRSKSSLHRVITSVISTVIIVMAMLMPMNAEAASSTTSKTIVLVPGMPINDPPGSPFNDYYTYNGIMDKNTIVIYVDAGRGDVYPTYFPLMKGEVVYVGSVSFSLVKWNLQYSAIYVKKLS